jgi:hypothetical protein
MDGMGWMGAESRLVAATVHTLCILTGSPSQAPRHMHVHAIEERATAQIEK